MNAQTRESYALKKDATRQDFLDAIAVWERGAGVTGHYTLALWRYRHRLGPDVKSQHMTDEFEYVRRALETDTEQTA